MTRPKTFEFGDVHVDVDRATVTRGGARVGIEPKAFDLLLFLVEHRDRLVTKDEILDSVWPRTFVTPNALTRAVAQLRKVLGDDPELPRYIETVPKRGYRFIGAVVIPGNPPADIASDVSSVPPRRVTSRVALAAIAAVIMLMSGAFVWLVLRSGSHRVPGSALTPVRVTITGSMNVDPALSPDGSAVAFASDRSGSFEIYVVGLARGSQEIALTGNGKNNVQPAWSPDGRWIAFASGNGSSLWVVPSTGGAPRQLVDSGSSPAWSPDSNWIVFTTQTSLVGQSSLRVIGRDGVGLRDLTRLGDPVGGHRSPAWSNNGRWIAFATVRGADEGSVWVVEAEGGTPRRLQTALGAGNVHFSPDDRALFYTGIGSILYRLSIDPVEGTTNGQPPEAVLSVPGDFNTISMSHSGLVAYGLTSTDANLWAIDLGPRDEPHEPVRLTNDVAGVTTMPHYSPDGQRLIFLQGGSGGQGLTPWVMNADGSGRSPLVTEGDEWGWPSWAPDSKRVLVQRFASGDKPLFWVDLATRQLTPTTLASDMETPRLSPNGREIAFWRIEANGSGNVWIQALDGGSPRRLTGDTEAVSYPWWSPDGQWLAVTLKRGKFSHVGVVSRNGGAVEQITDEGGFSAPASWSPDGNQIAFIGQRDGVWNIWVVSRRTRETRQLTHFTAPSDYVSYPSWSPDGRRITFAREIRRGGVWTTRVQ